MGKPDLERSAFAVTFWVELIENQCWGLKRSVSLLGFVPNERMVAVSGPSHRSSISDYADENPHKIFQVGTRRRFLGWVPYQGLGTPSC